MDLPRSSPETSRIRRENLEFEVLCLLESDPGISQREIARRLRISLGRINYCMKALMDHGTIRHVKYCSPERRRLYAYELTAGGLAQRASLTGDYLQRKLAEYDRLKTQIEGLQRTMNPGEGI